MKSIEFLIESSIDPKIKKILVGKGYKYLGRGADQMAFLEPGTGLVFKVFGTSNPLGWLWTGKKSDPNQLTDAQKSFKTFYELCHSDPSNEFLPNIVEYETFVFKGKPYLQIRMERLFEFKGREISYWNKLLERMAVAVHSNESFDDFWEFATRTLDPEYNYLNLTSRQNWMHQLIIHLGEEGLHKLWDTIIMLKKVAQKNGYQLDLHSGNFMLGSDGTPVISDPFYMGT